jgi:hypothetical protein
MKQVSKREMQLNRLNSKKSPERTRLVTIHQNARSRSVEAQRCQKDASERTPWARVTIAG